MPRKNKFNIIIIIQIYLLIKNVQEQIKMNFLYILTIDIYILIFSDFNKCVDEHNNELCMQRLIK